MQNNSLISRDKIYVACNVYYSEQSIVLYVIFKEYFLKNILSRLFTKIYLARKKLNSS